MNRAACVIGWLVIAAAVREAVNIAAIAIRNRRDLAKVAKAG